MGHKGNRCQTKYGAPPGERHGIGRGLRSPTAFLVTYVINMH